MKKAMSKKALDHDSFWSYDIRYSKSFTCPMWSYVVLCCPINVRSRINLSCRSSIGCFLNPEICGPRPSNWQLLRVFKFQKKGDWPLFTIFFLKSSLDRLSTGDLFSRIDFGMKSIWKARRWIIGQSG